MAIDFDKINRSVDLEGLRKDVENASENGTGDFPTVPAGKYEVALVSLEIKGTKKDNRPMLAASFKILSGDYKNQRLMPCIPPLSSIRKSGTKRAGQRP